jgi:hypothetical protein
MQWSIEMEEADVATDRTGIPSSKQSCTPGDPSCDLGAGAGCQMDIWTCFGGANPAIECAAAAASSVEATRPKTTAKTAWEVAARAAMQTALFGVAFPAGPGEVCTNAFRVDIPNGETLRLGAKAAGAKKDTDAIKISCE